MAQFKGHCGRVTLPGLVYLHCWTLVFLLFLCVLNIFHPCAWDRLPYFTGSSFQLSFSAVVFGGDLATRLSALFKRKCTRYLRTER